MAIRLLFLLPFALTAWVAAEGGMYIQILTAIAGWLVQAYIIWRCTAAGGE